MKQNNKTNMEQNKKRPKQSQIIISVVAAILAVVALILMIWMINKNGNTTPPQATLPKTTMPPQFTSKELKERYEYNNDVVGWITVPGTDINEEVLQASDNDYYLRRKIDKTNSIWGCYFVDFKCNLKSKEDLSRVTIIYGHSLKDYSDGKKFTQLKRYNDIDFCKQNQIISFSLLYEKLDFQIFAISKMPIDFNYIEAEPTNDKFGEVLAKLYETNINFFPEIKVSKDDHILLLQTCTSDKNYRYIVAAKLI
ncbi:MAG: class B sortase [Oscillospiraceae bacterium]